VVDQGYCATYRELWNEVGLAARGLLARGVRKGDRVGIWSPNRAEWTITQLATARIGAILVTINPAYKAAELQYVASYCFWRPARDPVTGDASARQRGARGLLALAREVIGLLAPQDHAEPGSTSSSLPARSRGC
jgi:acyl-CoA synthetase (AMP-forming)/AMP-acid ligase II